MLRDKNLAWNRASRREIENNRRLKYVASQRRQAALREAKKKNNK